MTQLYDKDWNNFSPRVSAAWDLTGEGKRVVRAGYGLYYDAFSQDFFVGQLPWNTFNPGPAYNDILFSFSPVSEIVGGEPVFDDVELQRVGRLHRRSIAADAVRSDLQRQLPARARRGRGVSSRLRRLAGP